MNNPLISILIPFKDAEDTLERALESCINQTYGNLEIILSDDGSSDSSKEIVKAFMKRDGRIRLIDNKGKGLSDGRNTLISESKGDYITFLDSDDALTLDAVSKMFEALVSNGADVVSAGYYLCKGGTPSTKTPVLTEAFCSNNKAEIHKYQLINCNNRCYVWGRLYKRELFDNIEFPKGMSYEDIYVTPQILENTACFVSIKEPVYYYILRNNSVTFSSKLTNHMDGIKARNHCDEFYNNNYPMLYGFSLDVSLNYGFYLLGKIKNLGKKNHTKEWDEAVAFIREKEKGATTNGTFLKLGLLLFHISPNLAGFLFNKYSVIKNRIR